MPCKKCYGQRNWAAKKSSHMGAFFCFLWMYKFGLTCVEATKDVNEYLAIWSFLSVNSENI